MRIKKIEDRLGIKPMEQKISQELEVLVEEDTDDEIILYTENPELQDEIEQYKLDRQDSISVLRKAKESIITVVESLTPNVEIGGEFKDVDSFAKLINTLTTVVGKLDDISNPQKVEHYIDPKSKNPIAKDGVINNTQTNVYVGSPKDLIKMIREEERKEKEEADNAVKSA